MNYIKTAGTVSVISVCLSLLFTFTTPGAAQAGNDKYANSSYEQGYNESDLTVFVFSQSNPGEMDSQVTELLPDINIRATQKWSTMGDEASDYDFSIVKKYHAYNILYIGGGTASVIFKKDFNTIEEFKDMATRDANGNLVPHDYIVPGAYRAALANPKFRQYIINYCKIQIDGGVDGIFLDEVLGGFSGGQMHNWNGNEGFDDYAIADFNKYLMEKYPDYTEKDWKKIFKMTDDNIVKKEVAYNNLTENFNYRKYLKANGWNGSSYNNSPLNPQNPLAKEWGKVTANRMYVENENSFTGKYLKSYWQEIVMALESYAKNKYNKDILITSNGIHPFVDFNSLGLYPYNPDEAAPDYKGADYVPVLNGHLNGSKSLIPLYKKMNVLNYQISGNVPLVIFIDWPCEMMTDYNNLPLSEKKDFWQIYGAEAYASGVYPAFHLKTTIYGDPTARSAGMLEFFRTYISFYKANKELYHKYAYASDKVVMNKANISQNLMFQKDYNRFILHMINHNYNKKIIPQQKLTVTISLARAPAKVYMMSPDFAGIKKPGFTYSNKELTITIDEIKYYNVIVCE
jgi:hypothetical protein